MSVERDIAAAWDGADDADPEPTVAAFEDYWRMDPEDSVRRFELANAYDWAGRERDAIPHYEGAIAGGLPPDRERRARIQLGSSLRDVGRPGEAVVVLAQVVEANPEDTSALCFLALALADDGRPREAVARLIEALSRSDEGDLPSYREALRRYAAELR